MRILVTGGSGQLGTDVAQAAAAKGWQVWAPEHTELDITHPAQVEAAIGDYRPDWVNRPRGSSTPLGRCRKGAAR